MRQLNSSNLGQNCFLSNLEKLGLQENPFRVTPPEDPQKLAQIFYGRDKGLDLAIPALYEGRNILVILNPVVKTH